MKLRKLFLQTNSPQTRETLAALSLHAAVVDGRLDLKEKTVVMDLLSSLSDEQVRRVCKRVLLDRKPVEEDFDRLPGRLEKTLALRLMECVAEADGRVASSELGMLVHLADRLNDELQGGARPRVSGKQPGDNPRAQGRPRVP